ncbi:MAG: helix-turn-helix transcriptional regulator [Myxococcales bacterium]|nr:helix-turn-helix transcriptional regulator [Myxococcales bacterium]
MPRSPQAVINSIGGNVRRLRLALEMTQDRLAKSAGLDVRYVQRIERGQVNPSISVLVLLANALEADVEELLVQARLAPARPSLSSSCSDQACARAPRTPSPWPG